MVKFHLLGLPKALAGTSGGFREWSFMALQPGAAWASRSPAPGCDFCEVALVF